MQALQLCRCPASASQRSLTQAYSFAVACVRSRCFATAAAAELDVANDDVDARLTEGRESTDGTAETPKAPRRPLSVTLLPYIYSANTTAPDTRLALPQGTRPVRRMKRMMNVDTMADLMKALDGSKLETEEECVRFLNLVVAFIRHENSLLLQEESPSPDVRERAAKVRKARDSFRLSSEEQHILLKKACVLVEQRRVPLIVASRLLRHRWFDELRASGGPTSQRYVMELVQSWMAEELLADRLDPRDARALLSNCAYALKSQVAHARAARRGNASSTASGGKASESQLSSFIGSLATTAVKDITSAAQVEGLLNVMWDVHSTGCGAPASFWDAMVQRIVQFNAALDTQLTEVAETGSRAGRDTRKHKRTESPLSRQAGHFFTTLTTRQLYRFLLVLKLSKWAGNATVLHQLADQALRNVAFELEASHHSDSNGGDTDKEITENSEAAAPASSGAMSIHPPPPPAPSLEHHAVLDAPHLVHRQPSKRDVARRIRRVADMRPQEFLELLSLAADLRVPIGVSATRVSEELLTPLVPHLSTKDLLALLQIVRYTESQSTELLQAVMRRLMENGPATPYALTLSKTLLRTAATAPDLFASLEMDDFVLFFLDLCEAQFSLCQPAVVVTLVDLLYTLGRRYDEHSVPGQRIRAVVHLFCAHMDRLLQLHVIAAAKVEPLLEITVLLRMRPRPELYPAVQELLSTRAAAEGQKQARHAARLESAGCSVDIPMEATPEGEENESNEGAAVVESSEFAAGRGARWEDLSETELPTVSKTARRVYGEIGYMFERMVVLKATLNKADFDIFRRDIEKAGLYSLFQGVQLFHLGHLEVQVAYTTDTARAAASKIPRALPWWMEKTITSIVLRKIARSRIHEGSTDDEVLKLLGHVHCDAAKVDTVVALLVESPLQMVKRQRALWLYVRELARRFGSDETKKSVSAYLTKSLF
ncbi:putative mitochondrial mitochondrial RNA binding protein [Leptomonas pyrrhocoris]|uniref:Putative mitochondrial mitochondrial RNA binding protein n=1 Tax=Leptomonas pyrrhocoris TaxID=157538 RepID=A0A0M9FQK0_LEPPY|nr:putative mitochondrial mitochondrial RNA binding protein [Leptomonas pyrrhocoris]KPA73889.1 putative mitochondrial mitochondrial RNA binding protein [Leptomonas pyrrhocoris]|eukprot:XP_015652328.1 putative mitochondrial mitochondrial RNA binding protein [Leptomonas pyrrhocoris]